MAEPHAVLKRLEEKSFLESRYDGATNQRGGRRKHLFRVTMSGRKALLHSRELRNNLWDSIPELAFGNGK
jgi:DNA-binding PadR family transcriptional regulator